MKHWEFVGYNFQNHFFYKVVFFMKLYKGFYFSEGWLLTGKTNFPHSHV